MSNAYPLFQVDDYVEFHAARILLLLHHSNGKIEGRTKLAKLDFFLRYPTALKQAINSGLVKNVDIGETLHIVANSIESKMIRYRYGPWDPKYPSVIAFLQSLHLIEVLSDRMETYQLTSEGSEAVEKLLDDDSFHNLDANCQAVARTLGQWNGTTLKNFIYEHFDVITELTMGQPIDRITGEA